MKKVTIHSNCNQCGICVVKCPEVFIENDDGNVYVASETVDEDAVLQDAVASCPLGAIELSEGESKKVVLDKYIKQLESCKNGIQITTKDIEFGEAYYRTVLVPSAGSSGYEYRSSSAAEKAGYEAFCRRSYSQVDNLILERITDYRVTVIKPYYSKDSNSVYTINNQKVEKILRSVASLIGVEKFTTDFTKVNIYPDSNDLTWRMLERGKLISDDFISNVKSEFDYSSSDYKVYIDWDDMEDWRGKDTYSYRAYEASDELGKDLGKALGWARHAIEERALGHIKWLIDLYNKDLKSCIEKKIAIIKKIDC